tara:strand:+ start:3632 stop:4438 length:807 start_codon:yes stop_codon:yes gene_type:complete
MKNDIKVSIILPTLNEKKNLEILIPSIVTEFNKLKIQDYEILVIDDNSTDGTDIYINNLSVEYLNLSYFQRSDEKSLPMSIWDGIKLSKYEYVMWLDADGSMTPKAMVKLMKTLIEFPESVVIGSRFVKGGGYKGVKDIRRDSIISAIKNVNKSNDSVTGMIFSIIFNYFLRYLNFGEVKDLTSGFIVGKKNYFILDVFNKASYGEYFIFLCDYLNKKNIKIYEVGYICETRINGESKTASNLKQLIQRGIPYIKAAIISKKVTYEDL